MGRSFDLNGTTVLIACLFWGFLWGLVGLVLAMPITVCMKLVFQTVPELNRWAELMSCSWQTPPRPGVRSARSQAVPTAIPCRNRTETPVRDRDGRPARTAGRGPCHARFDACERAGPGCRCEPQSSGS